MKTNTPRVHLPFAAIPFLSLFLLMSVRLPSQDTSATYSPERKAKCHPVRFETDGSDAHTVPFRNIHVYDVRPDTTKLGYFKGTILTTLYKLCTTPGDFNNYYNSFLRNDSGNSLYDLEIFVTKGWIFSDINNDDTKDKISLSIEVFMKSDIGFHPLYKFDSVTEVAGNSASGIKALQSLMKASAGRLMTKQEQKIKKPLSLEEIQTRYHASRFAFNKPKNKGMYKTFQDFKRDRPTETDFQVKFNLATDELYVKQADSNYTLTREAWGFFDGNVLFIKVGNNFFPVDLEGSTPNFFAAAQLKKENTTHLTLPPTMISAATIAVDYMISTKKRKLVKLKAYQLNALTGEVY